MGSLAGTQQEVGRNRLTTTPRFLVNLREAPATVFSNVSDMVLESEVTSSRY